MTDIRLHDILIVSCQQEVVLSVNGWRKFKSLKVNCKIESDKQHTNILIPRYAHKHTAFGTYMCIKLHVIVREQACTL